MQVYEFMLCIGTLCATIIDWALLHWVGASSWRWMVGLPLIPGIVIGGAVLVLPESPRWLVMHNRLEEVCVCMWVGGAGMEEEGSKAGG